MVARRHQVVIAEFVQLLGGTVQWGLDLRQDLMDDEIHELTILLSLLKKCFLPLIKKMIGDCGLQIQRVSFWSSPFMGCCVYVGRKLSRHVGGDFGVHWF